MVSLSGKDPDTCSNKSKATTGVDCNPHITARQIHLQEQNRLVHRFYKTSLKSYIS